jgi:hypothetical protein
MHISQCVSQIPPRRVAARRLCLTSACNHQQLPDPEQPTLKATAPNERMRLLSKVRKQIVREIDIDDLQFTHNEVGLLASFDGLHVEHTSTSSTPPACLTICIGVDFGKGQLCNCISWLL